MSKRIIKLSLLLILLFLLLNGCFEEKKEKQLMSINVKVDKTIIQGDGVEEITFSVEAFYNDGSTATVNADIFFIESRHGKIEQSSNKFKTDKASIDYTVSGKFQGKTSAAVSFIVKEEPKVTKIIFNTNSKKDIYANEEDLVVFIVEAVLDQYDQKMEGITPEIKYVDPTGNTVNHNSLEFKTAASGEYRFYAFYEGVKSEEVIISAESIYNNSEIVDRVKNWLIFDIIRLSNKTENNIDGLLSLPVSREGSTISWTAVAGLGGGKIEVKSGEVTLGNDNTRIDLTATISKEDISTSKTFELTVIKDPKLQDLEDVLFDLNKLNIKTILGSNLSGNEIITNLVLLKLGEKSSKINWKTEPENIIDPLSGSVERSEFDVNVKLIATVEKGTQNRIKEFNLTILQSRESLEKNVNDYIATLTFDNFKGANTANTDINSNLSLFTEGNKNTKVKWKVTGLQGGANLIVDSNSANFGEVTRGSSDITVTLTATVSKSDYEKEKSFVLLIKMSEGAIIENEVIEATNALTFDSIKGMNDLEGNITDNLVLQEFGINGTSINWIVKGEKNGVSIDTKSGVVIRGDADIVLLLIAEFSKDIVKKEKTFTLTIKESVESLNKKQIEKVLNELTFDNISAGNKDENNVRGTLDLISELNGVKLTWSADDPGNGAKINVVNGEVTRISSETSVTLKATLTLGNETREKEFVLKLLGTDDEMDVKSAKETLTFDEIKLKNKSEIKITGDLELVKIWQGTTVTWAVSELSNGASIDVNSGKLTRGTDNSNLVLTATITKGEFSDTNTFNLVIIKHNILPELQISYKVNGALLEVTGTTSDEDGAVEKIIFDWGNDQSDTIVENLSDFEVTKRYDTDGSFKVKVIAVDNLDEEKSFEFEITTANKEPVINLGITSKGLFVTLAGKIFDVDGTIKSSIIDWGDGSTEQVTSFDNINITHEYVEEKEFSIKITAIDDLDNSFEKIENIEMSNSGPIVDPKISVIGLNTYITGKATDSDGSIEEITVLWGDGKQDKVSSSFDNINIFHSYDEGGNYTIDIIAKDNSGKTGRYSENIDAVGSPPEIADFDLDIFALKLNLKTSISDLDGSVKEAKIDWGDGTEEVFNGGYDSINVSHTYAKGDTYKVTISAVDDKGARSEKSIDIKMDEIGWIPTPGDKQEDIGLKVELGWNLVGISGDDLRYDVYVGTSSPPTNQKKYKEKENTYLLEGMLTSKTYYWKVVAYKGDESFESPIWSFDTFKIANYEIIEAEEYNFFKLETLEDIQYNEQFTFKFVDEYIFLEEKTHVLEDIEYNNKYTFSFIDEYLFLDKKTGILKDIEYNEKFTFKFINEYLFLDEKTVSLDDIEYDEKFTFDFVDEYLFLDKNTDSLSDIEFTEKFTLKFVDEYLKLDKKTDVLVDLEYDEKYTFKFVSEKIFISENLATLLDIEYTANVVN